MGWALRLRLPLSWRAASLRLLDLAGLSRNLTPEYLAALGLDDCVPVAPEHRVTMLKRLREGAGVHIVTGPEGLAFWLPVSVEVHVDCVPDGYAFQEHCEPGMEWALRAVGVSPTLARGAVRHYVDGREPTAKAALRPRWEAACALLAEFETYTEPVGSIVVEASHIEAVIDLTTQLTILEKVETVAMDWEWNIDAAVGPMYEPEGLSIATADRTWYYPLWYLGAAPAFGYEDELRAAVQRTIMRTPTVWHNAKADLGTQWVGNPIDAFGSPLHDTLVMAFCAGESDLALKPLTRQQLGRDPLDFPGAMRNLPLETCRRYGGADARNTYDLFGVLFKKLHEREQWTVYNEIERPIIPLLTDMERFGHPVDMHRTEALYDIYSADEERLRQQFLESDGIDIGAKESNQRDLIKRRTGYDPGSLAKDAIAKIEGKWMDDLLRFRQVRHRRRAFLDKHLAKWHAAGSPEDFRLFTGYNQAGAPDQHDQRSFRKAPRSGRLSSSSPEFIPAWVGSAGASGGNLQNQPGEGAGNMEGLPNIHGIFVAPPGQVVWAKDYAQLEMRIRAARSRDANLMTAVQSPDGPHVDFQNRILQLSGKWIEKVAAKQGNFNAAYGGHVDMLRTILQKQRVFMGDDDLLTVVEANKQAYAGAYAYDAAIIEQAKVRGYSETAFGRRRYDEDIKNPDQRVAMHAERSLLNHVTQGTAADMLKIAMRLAIPVLRYYGAHLANQVHDELEGWCPSDVVAEFLYNLDLAVAPVTLPGVDFMMTGGSGPSWAEAKH